MKLFCTNHGGDWVGRASSRAVAAPLCRAKAGSSGASPHQTRPQSGFTLVEIAISLAIIGIALVAIIGVLPLGMNVQRDNREATVINQDASVFLEAIRNGARGQDDSTNYVYEITNSWTLYKTNGTVQRSGVNSYTYNNVSISSLIPPYSSGALTNGANIVGLLSMPEFIANIVNLPFTNYPAVSGLIDVAQRYGNFTCYSNHIVASVRSISGPAAEKPPQDNQIIQADAFSYRIYCVNAPVTMNIPPTWQPQSYDVGDQVYHRSIIWQATAPTVAGDVPGNGVVPTPWMQNSYINQLGGNLHELRLTFLWPLRPNGKLGTGRQTYRTLIAGQITQTNSFGQPLYFYQSQSFTNAP
jgi:prepilin-type N-terminal cleavage/methylation domain-containing protein